MEWGTTSTSNAGTARRIGAVEEAIGKLATQGILGVLLVISFGVIYFLAKGWRDEAKSHLETMRTSTRDLDAAARNVVQSMQIQAQAFNEQKAALQAARDSSQALASMVQSLFAMVAKGIGRSYTPGSFPAVSPDSSKGKR